MLRIILDVFVSVFAVFGFYYICLNFYSFLLHWRNNYQFNAELYIESDNSIPTEYIFKTFSFIREKYFPNMKIIINEKCPADIDTQKMKLNEKTISAK